jgi:hypothetical protein
MSSDAIIALAGNAVAVSIYIGIHIRTLQNQSEDISKLKTDVEVHDREIGSVYGALQMQREVRR